MRTFGMEGVGAIYQAYAAGRLVADDEVALVHGPEERGWRSLSVPLVDVRAALCRGVRRGFLSVCTARAVLGSARRCHYSERNWPEVLSGSGLPAERLRKLAEWISVERPSQKQLDAEECLAAALAPGRAVRPPQAVRTAFLDALAQDRGITLQPTPQTT